ncbi:MAG: ATP synthase F1 subunit delta [Bacteroidota bacterium]|nr:ATP synthase F1 subunit delta [Bacteroidota bacterium]
MNDSKISVRYAKALFSLALEKSVLPAVHADMEMLYLTTRTLPAFVQILESPVVKGSEKRALIQNVFEKQVNPITMSFLNLLLTNKREMYLENITRNFLSVYRQQSGKKAAVLSSAVALDQVTIAKMTQAVAARFNAVIEMTTEINPSLIGGFILQVEDQILDASVLTRLKQLRQELVKSN